MYCRTHPARVQPCMQGNMLAVARTRAERHAHQEANKDGLRVSLYKSYIYVYIYIGQCAGLVERLCLTYDLHDTGRKKIRVCVCVPVV